MALLTVAEVKEHVETDLADTAVQRLLDAAEDVMDRAAGPAGGSAITQYFENLAYTGGRSRWLFVGRPISSIGSIVERDDPGDTSITLASDDYEQRGDRRLLRRRDGTNPRLFWAPVVEVTYTPIDDTPLRKRVQVDLVKLGLAYSGHESQRDGSMRIDHGSLDAEDAKVRAVLRPLLNARSRLPAI